MAPPERFELPTTEVEARCSDPLSYRGRGLGGLLPPLPDADGSATRLYGIGTHSAVAEEALKDEVGRYSDYPPLARVCGPSAAIAREGIASMTTSPTEIAHGLRVYFPRRSSIKTAYSNVIEWMVAGLQIGPTDSGPGTGSYPTKLGSCPILPADSWRATAINGTPNHPSITLNPHALPSTSPAADT